MTKRLVEMEKRLSRQKKERETQSAAAGTSSVATRRQIGKRASNKASKPANDLRIRQMLLEATLKEAPTLIASTIAAAVDGDGQARKVLLDLLPRPSASPVPISSPLQGHDLCTTDGVRKAHAQVVDLGMRGKVGLAEAQQLSNLLVQLRDTYLSEEIDALRTEIEETRRLAQGGEATIDGETLEVVPTWGRFGQRR